GAGPWLSNVARDQVEVDQGEILVDPIAALIEPHGPQGHEAFCATNISGCDSNIFLRDPTLDGSLRYRGPHDHFPVVRKSFRMVFYKGKINRSLFNQASANGMKQHLICPRIKL